jgi:SpoVK/Ycf46/Vps4 family AAA+-type ATPase
MAREVVLPAKDMAEIRAIAASLRRTAKHKPLLFTGRNARAAAQAVAKEVGGEIHRVDLSSVVSKSIGQTEKNLDRVFGAAEGSRVMVFEEADALFGKRTEVKDSHDRYANIEVSYLLQRFEAHGGIVILVSQSARELPVTMRRRLSVRAFPPG